MPDDPDKPATDSAAADPLSVDGDAGTGLTRRLSLGLIGGLAAIPAQSSLGQTAPVPASVPASPLLARIDARQFGVLGDGKADDTANLNSAIAYAVRNGLILSARGELRTTGPITVRTNSGRNQADDEGLPEAAQIEWARGTRIVVSKDNEIGMVLHGRGIRMGDIQVEYARFQPKTHTGSVGIQFRDLSFSQLGYLDVRGANVGIAQRYASLDRDFFFDNEIDAMRVLRFSRMGVVIHPRSEGNTPNVIHSISAIAPWMEGPSGWEIPSTQSRLQQGIERAVWLHGCRGLVIGKINVETCAASKALLAIDQCRGVDIGAIHFEKVALTGNGAALIDAYLAYARIGAMTAYNFDTGRLAGVAGPTGLLSVTADGYLDIDVLEVASRHYAGRAPYFLVGEHGGHRIGRFVDDLPDAGGNAFLESGGAPRCMYTGKTLAPPLVASFDGLAIVPAFFAQGTGGTIRQSGLLAPATVRDTCRCYSRGVFTAPVAGLYELSAAASAAPGTTARFTLRRNGSQVIADWSHDTRTSVGGAARGSNKYYLSAGDTVSFELAQGECSADDSLVFSACFLSR